MYAVTKGRAMTIAISLSSLHVSFGKHRVLDGIDLEVGEGEILAMLGPNGAGKTTTIAVITTLLRPDTGVVRIFGVDVAENPRLAQRHLSLTGQSVAVDERLTGRENLVMMGRLSGLDRRDSRTRAEELLESFDLGEAAARRVSDYSGGMRRRLDLALSLVITPRLLVLDEPTTGLDPRSRRALWAAVRALASGGTTVLLTTQYLDEAEALADRIVLLDCGRIIAQGTASELTDRLGGAVVEVRGSEAEPRLSVSTDGTVAAVRAALSDAAADGVVVVRRPTLDDVFLDLTAQSAPRASPTHPLIEREAS